MCYIEGLGVISTEYICFLWGRVDSTGVCVIMCYKQGGGSNESGGAQLGRNKGSLVSLVGKSGREVFRVVRVPDIAILLNLKEGEKETPSRSP